MRCSQKRALCSPERSLSAIEIQCLFHDLLSVSCCSYCGIISFSLPLSAPLPQQRTDCGLESRWHLCSLIWRGEAGKEQRGLCNLQGDGSCSAWSEMCRDSGLCRLPSAQSHFWGSNSASEGLCQRAALWCFSSAVVG